MPDVGHDAVGKVHLGGPDLAVGLEIEGERCGLGHVIGDQAESACLADPRESPEQQRQLRVAGQAVTFFLGLRLEFEGADVETVEIDVINGAYVGRPVSRLTGTKTPDGERNHTREGQQNALHDAASTRLGTATQTPASWLHASWFYVISVSRERYAPRVKNSVTGEPRWHKALT